MNEELKNAASAEERQKQLDEKVVDKFWCTAVGFMTRALFTGFLILIYAAFIALCFVPAERSRYGAKKTEIDDFIQYAEAGKVDHAVIKDKTILYTVDEDGGQKTYSFATPRDIFKASEVVGELRDRNIKWTREADSAFDINVLDYIMPIFTFMLLMEAVPCLFTFISLKTGIRFPKFLTSDPLDEDEWDREYSLLEDDDAE